MTVKAINYSLYMDKEVSKETKRALKEFSKLNPTVREELFHKAKNSMANTIFDEQQSIDYIKGVKDTLKFVSRYF